MTRHWLARLSFSFIIIGAIFAWYGYLALTGRGGEAGTGRITLYFIVAAAAFVLGALGMRERHRSSDDPR